MNDDFTLFIFVATHSRARDTPNLFPSTAELLEFMQKRKPRVKTRHLYIFASLTTSYVLAVYEPKLRRDDSLIIHES